MRHTSYTCLILLFAWTGVAHSTILNIPQRYQEQDQWCWAGVTQSVLEYYGIEASQSQIAQYGTNGVNTWNWIWGSTTFPTRRGIDLILNKFAELPTGQYSSALSQVILEAHISTGKPPIIRWGWSTGGGHFVVGKGIQNGYVHLMDPWYGPTINTYDWVYSGSYHTWTHTLTNNKSGPLPSAPAPQQSKFLPYLNLLLNREVSISSSFSQK